MVKLVAVALLMCCTFIVACRHETPPPERRQILWSGWIEETAAQRGYIKRGEFAQFGCPPGWRGIEDTAAGLRGKEVSTVYMGTDPPPRDGTVTCVAQADFALPPPYAHPSQQPIRQPLAPVWLEIGPDSTTIGFRSELPLHAALYFAQDTPCGPRVIGVRLRDLLKWLADPPSATKRDFLGMVSAGCPGGDTAR